jgi:hypothetical protein
MVWDAINRGVLKKNAAKFVTLVALVIVAERGKGRYSLRSPGYAGN